MDDTSLSELLEKRAKLEKQLVSMQEIQKNIEAIDRVLKLMNYNPQRNGSGAQPVSGALVIPEQYSATLRWEQKCAWVLRAIKIGYATEVAAEFVRFEPTLTLKEAEERAKYFLSKMYREGKIDVAAKHGKKYQYRLKPEEEMK
jgi:hypothetical protein